MYNTDDGTNVMFNMFVADTAADIKEGVNYCARYTQTSPDGCDAMDWTADIEWIAMPQASAVVSTGRCGRGFGVADLLALQKAERRAAECCVTL